MDNYEEHSKFLRDMASEFVNLIDSGTNGTRENKQTLKQLLSRLSLATVNLSRPSKWEAPDNYVPPNDEDIRASIGVRFPEFGYYNSVSEVVSNIGSVKCDVGDAVDDVLDIYKDLRESVWCYDNIGAKEGINYLVSSYFYHWGRHLRDLQLYLHELDVAT